jgi:hypothetical protein
MREHGFWWYMPLILGRNDVLGDGHRRLTVARELQLVSVPAVRVDKAADVLWSEINGLRRTVSGSETLEAVVLGLSQPPPQHVKEIDRFLQIVGLEEASKDYMRGVAPRIIDIAMRVGRYIGSTDDKMLACIVTWLRRQNAQRNARTAMDGGIDPELLFGLIVDDRPLPKPTWKQTESAGA